VHLCALAVANFPELLNFSSLPSRGRFFPQAVAVPTLFLTQCSEHNQTK